MKKILLLIIILLVVGLIAYPTVRYFLWAKNFKQEKSSLTCVSNTEEVTDLDAKFESFVISNEKNEYVELNEEEVVSLLSSLNFQGSSKIDDICVVSEKGTWKIYANLVLGGLNIPWIYFDVVKDEMQTAQLYVSSISIGNMPIPSFISKVLLEKVNTGISDAITHVNENSFAGREIDNIELLDNKIVVKGSI